MTRAFARQLILVLAAKRIAFRLERRNSLYYVSFPKDRHGEVMRALGIHVV
jgi:hypothetical protein